MNLNILKTTITNLGTLQLIILTCNATYEVSRL